MFISNVYYTKGKRLHSLNSLLLFYLCEKQTFWKLNLLPADIGVSVDQLKKFSESVIDPKWLLKVEATFFCCDSNIPFSTKICFRLCYNSHPRLNVCMLSDVVWSCNQHLVSQIIVKWLVYLDHIRSKHFSTKCGIEIATEYLSLGSIKQELFLPCMKF